MDKATGEIIDNAQGYGYKTKRKAYAAYNWKNRYVRAFLMFSARTSSRLHSTNGGSRMKTLKQFKAEQMKTPDFATAYAELEPEMNVIRAIVDTRIAQNLTQKELAEKTGIAQTEISRIENGTRNPSLKILQRLADGMDMVLKVSFEPKKKIKAQ